jgi:NAD(P)-dependent dehydrogenase (short-subunit alcohol dehydrogenase family)
LRFEGKTTLVTGAGSGMGRAMAHAFHDEGARVVAVDIRTDAASATVAELERGAAQAADISDAEAVDRLARDVLADVGTVDILCNNAGVLDDYAPAHDTSPELWSRIIGVNLTGPFLMSRAFVPSMVEKGGGVIVNTASISSFVAGGGGAAYTSSKHGLLGLTRQLAFDYGRSGVRANAICPGAIATEMTAHLRGEDGANEHVDASIAATPAGRWGTPEEIAALAVFLASEEAGFMHGSPVLIDGGWTLS